MNSRFIDTSYLIALVNPEDNLHARAVSLYHSVSSGLFVTSQMVLVELLNYFSEKGSFWRQEVLSIVRDVNMGYSLTDCASMLIMKSEGMHEILTADRHFIQEGFKALL